MLNALDALLQLPDPCAIQQDEQGTRTRTPLLHQPGPKASPADIATLAAQLNGCSNAMLELYRQYDGLRLYAMRDDPECALILLPISGMAGAKEDLASWLDIDSDGLEDDETGAFITSDGRQASWGYPDWWETAVVFAYFGYGPESLVMSTQGEHAGKVFIYEHDGGNGTSWVADSFEDMMHHLLHDPLPFLHRYYGTYWLNMVSVTGGNGE